MRRNAAGSVGIKENVCIREMHRIYLFIYFQFSSILTNCYQRGSCLPYGTPTKEAMELTVVINFHHTEDLTGDRTRDLSILSSTP